MAAGCCLGLPAVPESFPLEAAELGTAWRV